MLKINLTHHYPRIDYLPSKPEDKIQFEKLKALYDSKARDKNSK